MARVLSLLACVLALGAIAGAQSDAAPSDAAQPAAAAAATEQPPLTKDVKIAWEQTPETLSFTFNTTGTEWTNFFYNTTMSGDNSVLRVVFQNDKDTKFMRLHLSAPVIGQETRAQVTEAGAQLVLKKSRAGMWNSIVYLTSEEPLSATVNVTMPTSDVITVEVLEYQDLATTTARILARAPGGDDIAEGSVEQVAALLLRAVERATPQCVAEDFCTCTLPLVFDGAQCIDGSAWQSKGHVLSANALPYLQPPAEEGEKPALRYLGPDELLKLDDGDFGTVFNGYQDEVANAPRWPYLMYAQTMAGWNILVVGAGLAYFEPLVFAQHGANVTLLDSVPANLQLIERLRTLSNIPRNLVHTVEYAGEETLRAMPTGFDAVLVLDSLTRAPVELLSGEYVELLGRLAPGGRWMQLAPSKTRYLAAGKPLLLNFGSTQGPLVARWADWLDLPKLVRILSPVQPSFHVVFNTEVGSHPPRGADRFTWIDLLYLGSGPK